MATRWFRALCILMLGIGSPSVCAQDPEKSPEKSSESVSEPPGLSDQKAPESTEKKDDAPAESATEMPAEKKPEFIPLWMKPGNYFHGRSNKDAKPERLEMNGKVVASLVHRMQKVTYVAWKEQTLLTRTKKGQRKETMGLAFFRSEKGTCYITATEPKSLKLGSYYMIVPEVEVIKTDKDKNMRRVRQDLANHPWAKELACKNPGRTLIAIGAYELQAAWE